MAEQSILDRVIPFRILRRLPYEGLRYLLTAEDLMYANSQHCPLAVALGDPVSTGCDVTYSLTSGPEHTMTVRCQETCFEANSFIHWWDSGKDLRRNRREELRITPMRNAVSAAIAEKQGEAIHAPR